MLNLHLLRIFKEVAERGSFTRAAQALSISQPAVSKAVRDFEEQVGNPLIERGRGGPRPTRLGEILLANAQELFKVERAMEEVIRSSKGIESGQLAIGASTTVAIYYLPPCIGAFHKAHPDIQLELHSANTREIAAKLKRREIDIALVEGPVNDPELVVQPWRSEELVLVSGIDHPLARRKTVGEKDALSDCLLLIREPGSGTREVVTEALRAARIRPMRLMEVNSTEAVKRLVAAGVGVALVSRDAAEDFLRSGRLVEVRIKGLSVNRVLARLTIRNRRETSAVKAFNKILDRSRDARFPTRPA